VVVMIAVTFGTPVSITVAGMVAPVTAVMDLATVSKLRMPVTATLRGPRSILMVMPTLAIRPIIRLLRLLRLLLLLVANQYHHQYCE
jgi:hypothetical protein